MKRPTILILTCGFGDGHNSAAKSLQAAFLALPEAPEAVMKDILNLAHPLVNRWATRAYAAVITHFPRWWARFYTRSEQLDLNKSRWKASMLGRVLHQLQLLLEIHAPVAVVSTYPMYAHFLDLLRAQGVPMPKLFTVITDSITINHIWLNAPSDWLLVADPMTAEVVAAHALAKDHVRVTGFPVHPVFAELAKTAAPDGPPWRMLFFPATKETEFLATLEALGPLLDAGAQLTLPLGRHHARLSPAVAGYCADHPRRHVTALDWTDQVPRLLHESHLVIGKAGGATTHEVLAAACPMIINCVVPGQEEGNAELLTTSGCAIRARGAAEVAAAAGNILDPATGARAAMIAVMRKLGKPNASAEAARFVMENK